MNRPLASLLAIALIVLIVPAWAGEVKEDPLDRQVQEIASELRCAVCQNESVADSHADLAADMRRIIREQLQAGKSRREIVDYFVARYGDYILMKPPLDRAGMPLWVIPLVLMVILGTSAFLFLKHRRRDQLPAAPVLSPEEAARVRAAREEALK
jgi:cytochrome c-type biogenesis protein CcmH